MWACCAVAHNDVLECAVALRTSFYIYGVIVQYMCLCIKCQPTLLIQPYIITVHSKSCSATMSAPASTIQLTKEERDALKDVAVANFNASLRREIAFWDHVRDWNGANGGIRALGNSLPRANSTVIFQEMFSAVNEEYERSKRNALQDKRARAANVGVDSTIIETIVPPQPPRLPTTAAMCKKAGVPEPPPSLKRQRRE